MVDFGSPDIRDIHTGVYEDEAAELARLASGKRVLELGTWHGFSAVTMGKTAQSVLTCDWHQGDDHAGRMETAAIFLNNIERYGVRDKVQALIGRFEDTMPYLREGVFDFAFIDGYHDVESTYRDIVTVTGLLTKVGDTIAIHDYERDLNGVPFEVDAALDRWMPFQSEWVHKHVVNSLYVMERVA